MVQPIEAISPASIKANPNLDVEPISDPSTLDGPPGLSIGEKIHIVDTIKTSLSSQYNMETIELVNRSAVMSSLQIDACSYQRSMDKVIAESTTPVIENESLPMSPAALIKSETNQDTSELSTLDGPSGL